LAARLIQTGKKGKGGEEKKKKKGETGQGLNGLIFTQLQLFC